MKSKLIAGLFIGLLIGAAAAYFLLQENTNVTSETGTAKQLYSCGMHPEVISDKPGNCPICGMKLTPIKGSGTEHTKTETGEILYWRAPMDPTEIYDKPGKSKMGMDLIPVREGEEAGGAGSITVDGTIQQNMNLRTAPVTKRNINRIIRAFGKVTYAQDKQYSVNTKINGWIEKLYVNTTGQRVKKGDPLLEIYSPELVSTQEEYLLALNNFEKLSESGFENVKSGAETMLASARNRLEFWDIPADEITKLENTKQVKRTILLRAPVNGIVTHKAVVEGDKVAPGMDLFHISDLSKIWVEATVYESELLLIKEGQKALLELDYVNSDILTGQVDFIYPYLDEKSGSANVRLVFPNQNELLKPDMFATVRIFNQSLSNVLAVPSEAIIRSGSRNIVFIAKANGKFEPREIKIGAESDEGYVQVVSGLFENEIVVTSGQFLLDSESRTREAIAKMRTANRQTEHSPAAEPDTTMRHSQNGHEGYEHEKVESSLTQKFEEMTDAHMTDSHKEHVHELYACPMHPDFITSDPEGRCPVCGMKLTAVSELGDKVDLGKAEMYTCPMHTDFVTTDKNGKCPVCGMKLEKVN
ncbi:efflux RND transporter periplasmic adaptor subunit [candidate division KSB1 bacterium]|nr:efflux RND transporter periplasmic adaptor subunit [candidate division KSB1 bacterium]